MGLSIYGGSLLCVIYHLDDVQELSCQTSNAYHICWWAHSSISHAMKASVLKHIDLFSVMQQICPIFLNCSITDFQFNYCIYFSLLANFGYYAVFEDVFDVQKDKSPSFPARNIRRTIIIFTAAMFTTDLKVSFMFGRRMKVSVTQA